eukprot:scaffold226028_cov42-Prasinocladus_malaysianus.AAC.2
MTLDVKPGQSQWRRIDKSEMSSDGELRGQLTEAGHSHRKRRFPHALPGHGRQVVCHAAGDVQQGELGGQSPVASPACYLTSVNLRAVAYRHGVENATDAEGRLDVPWGSCLPVSRQHLRAVFGNLRERGRVEGKHQVVRTGKEALLWAGRGQHPDMMTAQIG